MSNESLGLNQERDPKIESIEKLEEILKILEQSPIVQASLKFQEMSSEAKDIIYNEHTGVGRDIRDALGAIGRFHDSTHPDMALYNRIKTELQYLKN